MKKYAVLDNNSQVVNIIVAGSLDIAESITSSYCALVPVGAFVEIGYKYADGAFTPPVAEEPIIEAPEFIAE